VKDNKKVVPVQYVNDSFSHLFIKFREENPGEKLCSSVFRRYTNKRFKKAVKETNLCENCENG